MIEDTGEQKSPISEEINDVVQKVADSVVPSVTREQAMTQMAIHDTEKQEAVEDPKIVTPNGAIELVAIETDPEMLCRVSEDVVEEEDREDIRCNLHASMSLLGSAAAGLSAIQIGVPKRAFMVRAPIPTDRIPFKLRLTNQDTEELLFFVNAEIMPGPGGEVGRYPKTVDEGCLSIPDRIFQVERPTRVKVRDDINGEREYRGKLARVILHELDHTLGVTLYQSGREVVAETPRCADVAQELENEIVEAAIAQFQERVADGSAPVT